MANPSDTEHRYCPARRRFLKQLGLSAAAMATLPLQSCGLFDEPEMKLGKLEALKTAGHWVKEFNGDLIFTALNENGQPYTLSLICSHRQCTVEYYPEDTRFICPCHKGEYTPTGEVLSGQPEHPLRMFVTEQRGDELWVLNEFARDDW